MSEPDTFVVSVEKEIEIDLNDTSAVSLMNRTDAETAEEAIAQKTAIDETDQVEATQKLLNLNVDVDGPSDD